MYLLPEIYECVLLLLPCVFNVCMYIINQAALTTLFIHEPKLIITYDIFFLLSFTYWKQLCKFTLVRHYGSNYDLAHWLYMYHILYIYLHIFTYLKECFRICVYNWLTLWAGQSHNIISGKYNLLFPCNGQFNMVRLFWHSISIWLLWVCDFDPSYYLFDFIYLCW